MSAPLVPSTPGGPAGEVEADLEHAEHRRAVDARLREAIEGGARSFEEVLAVTDGADPRMVARRVRGLGLALDDEAGADALDPWIPELHARDFEWYFTPRCAAELAARVGEPGASVLCLGTPTVAFALLDAGRVRRVTLVDRNPLAFRRGPHRHAALEARLEDLAAARLDAGAYDVAVLDAPWYPDALGHWLEVAAAAVRPGGKIVLALLPELHRPSARADRATILARARALGTVEVERGRFTYVTPRFEREALATAGVRVPAAWRRADLVEIMVEHAPATTRHARAPEPAWLRFVIGAQVVQLDPDAPSEPGELLRSIDGDPSFRYASISTRDPRRAEIGLWTSRSRVARVRHPAVVAALLERLAATGDARALADAQGLRAIPPPQRQSLLDALGTIVGPLPLAPA